MFLPILENQNILLFKLELTHIGHDVCNGSHYSLFPGLTRSQDNRNIKQHFWNVGIIMNIIKEQKIRRNLHQNCAKKWMAKSRKQKLDFPHQFHSCLIHKAATAYSTIYPKLISQEYLESHLPLHSGVSHDNLSHLPQVLLGQAQ